MNTIEKANEYAIRESLKFNDEKVYIIGNEYGSFSTSVSDIPYIDEDMGFYLVDHFYLNGEEIDV
jgi:hypothetical protein